jgi:hypothetical protein
MEEKKCKILFVCLEIICLVILLPLFYWGSVKLLFVPLSDLTYYPNQKISILTAFIIVLSFDAIWLILMKLCFKGKAHIKLIITLFVLAFSAVILTCFVLAEALKGAFE